MIVEFWDWFKSISNSLLQNPTNADLVHQIDNKVSEFGVFDWEIGPWEPEIFYFAISPNLNESKLKLTREFIKYAPVCVGWHFLPSKPVKKEWQGIWKMKNQIGSEILIDTHNWKYILYETENRAFYMDIRIDNNIDGGIDTVNTAIEIVLTGYLGEEMFMEFIKNIRIVKSFGEDQDKATLIKHIKKHLESIT
ncbi:MAG: hypothetical protein ACXVAY_12905 [Mucilaginibacter sp.]